MSRSRKLKIRLVKLANLIFAPKMEQWHSVIVVFPVNYEGGGMSGFFDVVQRSSKYYGSYCESWEHKYKPI